MGIFRCRMMDRLIKNLEKITRDAFSHEANDIGLEESDIDFIRINSKPDNWKKYEQWTQWEFTNEDNLSGFLLLNLKNMTFKINNNNFNIGNNSSINQISMTQADDVNRVFPDSIYVVDDPNKYSSSSNDWYLKIVGITDKYIKFQCSMTELETVALCFNDMLLYIVDKNKKTHKKRFKFVIKEPYASNFKPKSNIIKDKRGRRPGIWFRLWEREKGGSKEIWKSMLISEKNKLRQSYKWFSPFAIKHGKDSIRQWDMLDTKTQNTIRLSFVDVGTKRKSQLISKDERPIYCFVPTETTQDRLVLCRVIFPIYGTQCKVWVITDHSKNNMRIHNLDEVTFVSQCRLISLPLSKGNYGNYTISRMDFAISVLDCCDMKKTQTHFVKFDNDNNIGFVSR